MLHTFRLVLEPLLPEHADVLSLDFPIKAYTSLSPTLLRKAFKPFAKDISSCLPESHLTCRKNG